MKLFAISESHLTDRITKNLELTSSVFIYMPAMSIPFSENENSEALPTLRRHVFDMSEARQLIGQRHQQLRL